MSIVDESPVSRATLDDIKVAGRFRRDLGDLSDLKSSIESVGLLHPIVVTSDLELVAGQRRLEAMRELGAIEVPVRVVRDLGEASERLIAERDENTCRKEMTSSELYALGKALEQLERPKAKARQREAGRQHGRGSDRSGSAEPNLSTPRTDEVVAPAVDMSTSQWKRLKHIGDRASAGDQEAASVMDNINSGKQTVSAGYKSLQSKQPVSDLGNVGDQRSIPRKKGPTQQLVQLAEKVKQYGELARMIDLQGLTKQEADSIAADLSEGLAALATLKNQLRKVEG